MKIVARILSSIFFLLIIWFLGFGYYIFTLEQIPSDNRSIADGIVVLTGSPGRISLGVSLLKQKLGKKLFISGVQKGVSAKLLSQKQAIPDDLKAYLEDSHLGYAAHNTIENALEIATWIKLNNVKTIRLVTADYHVKRSVLELSSIAPSVKIITHPLKTIQKIDAAILKLLWNEYIKLTVRFMETYYQNN